MDKEKQPELLLTEKTIKVISDIVSKGDRVELIPVKDGVKIIHIRRKEINLS